MKDWKIIHCRVSELEAKLNEVAEDYALHITHITNENVENPWVTLFLLHKRNLQPQQIMGVGQAQKFRQ